jgi:SOS-response transcriptional repressor LexA
LAQREQELSKRTEELEQQTEARSSAQIQEQLTALQTEHAVALKEVESKWTTRAESWFTQRENPQNEIEAPRVENAQSG